MTIMKMSNKGLRNLQYDFPHSKNLGISSSDEDKKSNTFGISYGELKRQARERAMFYIILDIIKTIGDGIEDSTDIMKKHNISLELLIGLLEFIDERGLIEVGSQYPEGKCYGLTEKGSFALAYYRKARDLINLEQIQI